MFLWRKTNTTIHTVGSRPPLPTFHLSGVLVHYPISSLASIFLVSQKSEGAGKKAKVRRQERGSIFLPWTFLYQDKKVTDQPLNANDAIKRIVLLKSIFNIDYKFIVPAPKNATHRFNVSMAQNKYNITYGGLTPTATNISPLWGWVHYKMRTMQSKRITLLKLNAIQKYQLIHPCTLVEANNTE